MATSANAGFTFETRNKFVIAPRVSGVAAIGNDFLTDGLGDFFNYHQDSTTDPYIHPLDLQYYKYSFLGEVVASSGPSVVYAGEYQISYDVVPFGIPDVPLSIGTFLITATYQDPMHATLEGSLVQYPNFIVEDPNFFDFSYGGNPMSYEGIFTAQAASYDQGGQIHGIIRQTAPAPGVIATLAGSLLFVSRRRR
ncbi:MAG: hypothetical protein JSR77_06900 [Planctomycetes bacterium]|nr:hypothetical protein [Planctomycetota bacterium]